MLHAHEKHRFDPCLLTAAPLFADWAERNRVPYKELEGCYKGQREKTYLVTVPHIERVYRDRIMAGEESALFLTGHPVDSARGRRFAYLVHLDERGQAREVEALGDWRQVTAHEAVQRHSWTFDPSTGLYYVAGPAPIGSVSLAAPYQVEKLGLRR